MISKAASFWTKTSRVSNEEYKQIEIENQKVRNTAHVKREIRSLLSTHPASSTLPPLSFPGCQLAVRQVSTQGMVEITVTFTIITINVFIKWLQYLTISTSVRLRHLLNCCLLSQFCQSDHHRQFTHYELFLRTSGVWATTGGWWERHGRRRRGGVVNQGLAFASYLFSFSMPNPKYSKLLWLNNLQVARTLSLVHPASATTSPFSSSQAGEFLKHYEMRR